MDDFWNHCLNHLQQSLPAQQFNTWIRCLRCEENTQNQPHILAPNRFILQWVRDRYLASIQDQASHFFGAPIPVTIGLSTVNPGISPVVNKVQRPPAPPPAPVIPKPEARIHSPAMAYYTPPAVETPPPPPPAPPVQEMLPMAPAIITSSSSASAYSKTRLNPDFTFENLVTGRANDLARAAAYQVAGNPGTSYNPLFVYGGVGLGKTHLIHAIGNAAWNHNRDLVVRYVHSEDYYADVVRAFQQKSFDQFKRYYRSLDLLLIDDIQFFNNKNRTQEEFFHAFNALTEAKKQIVITCDTYPKDIAGLEDRLISRFDWGLTVQIEPPELEMRVAIVKNKAEAEAIDLGDDVAFLIAKNLRSNVRELEGALKKVLAFARFHARAITLDLAKEALKDLLGAHNRQITIEHIQKTVADYYKIKLADMHSRKRTRNIARPRQVAMWLAKELTPVSYPAIGENFGGRDHTTVLHAYRNISKLRLGDAQLNHDLHVLTQVLRG